MKSVILKWIAIFVVYAIVLGFVMPAAVSAKDSLINIGGIAVAIVFLIAIPALWLESKSKSIRKFLKKVI